jgi:hypothetical protein
MNETLLARSTGGLFIVAFILAVVGGIMFMGRKQLGWPIAQSRRYLFWERSVWIAGIVLLTLGLSLFAWMLQTEGENILSRLGVTGFLIGAVLIVVAEAVSLDTQQWPGYLVRLSVVLLLLSQALFGGAMLQIDRLPQWVGWATIIWNLGWFVVLLRAKDPYYPAMYYIIPLIIGVILINPAT